MERVEYKSIPEFLETVINVYDTAINIDENGDVAIVAMYDEAKEIIKELISTYEFDIISIELEDSDFNDYHDEYIISLLKDNGQDKIACEKLKKSNGYVSDYPISAFVMDDCNSACLKYIKSNIVVEVGIVDEEDKKSDLDTCNSNSVYVSRDDNGKPVGFQTSWSDRIDGVNCYSSYSFYSDNCDELHKVADAFGVNL